MLALYFVPSLGGSNKMLKNLISFWHCVVLYCTVCLLNVVHLCREVGLAG